MPKSFFVTTIFYGFCLFLLNISVFKMTAAAILKASSIAELNDIIRKQKQDANSEVMKVDFDYFFIAMILFK